MRVRVCVFAALIVSLSACVSQCCVRLKIAHCKRGSLSETKGQTSQDVNDGLQILSDGLVVQKLINKCLFIYSKISF